MIENVCKLLIFSWISQPLVFLFAVWMEYLQDFLVLRQYNTKDISDLYFHSPGYDGGRKHDILEIWSYNMDNKTTRDVLYYFNEYDILNCEFKIQFEHIDYCTFVKFP